MAKKGALAVGYAYPVVVAGFALASFVLAYFYLMDWLPCGPTRQVGCLDRATYFGFEGVIYALLGLLAWRAVSRARRGKDMWTMRVYWPAVLGAFALLSLVAYLVAVIPRRGCDVAPWYPLYGCWDPGVTALRVAVALVLTGVFTFGMAMAADSGKGAAEPADAPGEQDAPPAEGDEEIAAR